MAAMGPPGGGRNTISNRLLSQFSIINMTFPSESAVIRIFGTMLNQHLMDFDEQLKQIGMSKCGPCSFFNLKIHKPFLNPFFCPGKLQILLRQLWTCTMVLLTRCSPLLPKCIIYLI